MDIRAELYALLTTQDRIRSAIDKLPSLTVDHVNLDDSCPICLARFASILSDEAELKESGQYDDELEFETGITKLDGCGHLFCRKDLLEWIRGFHGSCPTCRHVFLDIRPPSESDGESSDGDYFPYEDDEEDEEGEDDFDGDAEEFAEESDIDEMDLDVDEIWEDADLTDSEGDAEAEWTDGDATFSETDMSVSAEPDDSTAVEGMDETLCESDEAADPRK